MSTLPVDKQQWLSDQLSLVAIEKSNRSVDLVFEQSHSRLHKEPATFNALQIKQLHKCIPQWHVEQLSTDCIARILVLSTFTDAAQLAEQMRRLLHHADLTGQLALYKGLPLYTPSAALNDSLAKGLCSCDRRVFEAIAHHNPYTRERQATAQTVSDELWELVLPYMDAAECREFHLQKAS